MSDTDVPLVSVVVPTYDRPAYLATAVESVVAQTHPRVELVVVDDHSPTPAASVLEDAATESLAATECIRHEENRGGNAARNTGIRHASGEFVAFLDDDDVWRPGKLAAQVAAFDAAPSSVGLVFTGAQFVDGDGTVVSESVPRDAVVGDATRRLLLGETVVGGFSRVMVRASVIDDVGLPDERFPNWQDREWYLRVAREYDFRAVTEPLVHYRLATHDQVSDDFAARRDVAFPLLLEKHRSLAAEYGPTMERRFVAGHACNVAVYGLRTGHYVDAVRFLARSLREYPLAVRTYGYLLLAAGGPLTYGSAKRLKRGFERLRRHA